jgi:hypothetical protein
VITQFDGLACGAFEGRAVWRLFNATTYALTGRVVENSDVTPRLHKIIDGVCQAVH